MNILLIGEYNRTHFNIKNGLEHLGQNVVIISNTDGFKKVDVDIEINEYNETLWFKILCYFKLYYIAKKIVSFYVKKQFYSNKNILSGFDIIQLVNEAPFNISLKSQLKIFDWLQQWNSNAKFYLLSCGLDYPSVSFAYHKKFRYSILTPYFEGRIPKKDHAIGLRYLSNDYKTLHHYLYNLIEGVIAKDLDYHIPLEHHPKYLGMIPHAIDLSQLTYEAPNMSNKIIIFHGINTHNYYKKGNDIFEAALTIVNKTHGKHIEIISTKNLSYKKYIASFNKAHILLDQVYAYDQGYNALEAMAKGKVVFTGAEKEWEIYYDVSSDTIAINALPDANAIAKKLIWLIENPEQIITISKKGRQFVEQYHDHIYCAKQYLKKWA